MEKKWIKTEKRTSQTVDNIEEVIELIDDKIRENYTAKIWYSFDGSYDEIRNQLSKFYFSIPHIKEIQMVVECTDLYHTIHEQIIKIHITDEQLNDIYEQLSQNGFITSLDYFEVPFQN